MFLLLPVEDELLDVSSLESALDVSSHESDLEVSSRESGRYSKTSIY